MNHPLTLGDSVLDEDHLRLEDLVLQLRDAPLDEVELDRRLADIEKNQRRGGDNSMGATNGDSSPPPSAPPPVSFQVPAEKSPGVTFPAASPEKPPAPEVKPRLTMSVVDAENARSDAKGDKEEPQLRIPTNTGVSGVLLNGFHARPAGGLGGSAGSVTGATQIGAPFVSRLKGDAILPNGWKVADLRDCFLGGTAIGNLSAERATAIAKTLSCVRPNGEVLEANVKAYALDEDGNHGLAGHVVSKQGAVLGQSFLTGIAAGLGQALTPTSFSALSTTGSSPFATPNASIVAQTAVGQGLNNASAQLSRFYLEFARELFPGVEVVSGTRVTWVFQEGFELRKTSTRPM